VDYLLPVPGELTNYLYWFCQQLVNWKYQAKQIALDLEETFQRKKLQRKRKIQGIVHILKTDKKRRNKWTNRNSKHSTSKGTKKKFFKKTSPINKKALVK